MRIAIALALAGGLAACELEPPPPPSSAPSPPRAAVPTPVPPAATGSAAPAPPAPRAPPAPIDVTPECVETGTHVADAIIASAKDPSLRANYEQARTRIVRATAEACTSQRWSPEAQQCYGAAKLEADVRACEAKFPPPSAPTPRRPATN